MSYAIHCTPNFYAGDIHRRDKTHLLPDAYGNVLALATEQDAETIVGMLSDHGDGPYLLADNQYAPPGYRVVESARPGYNLVAAMAQLDLQDTFAPDGSRLPMLSPF